LVVRIGFVVLVGVVGLRAVFVVGFCLVSLGRIIAVGN